MARFPCLLAPLLVAVAACVPGGSDPDACRQGAVMATDGHRAAFRPGAVTVAAVGDVLMHRFLQQEAQTDSYGALIAPVAPYLGMADITVANLEGPAAQGLTVTGREVSLPPERLYDGQAYTGYPTFNYHPALITALGEAGVDVLQTANNHAMDRGPAGIDRTLAAIETAGLAHTGTRARGEDGPWHGVVRAGGHSVAFLACSYSTNGRADPHGQVLLCYGDEAEVLATIRRLRADPAVDAVILLPHWGQEYAPAPDANQRRLARAALEAGAAAVIGTHPHVLQPLEEITTSDGRRGIVAYSLGNFISSQWALPRRTSAILYLDLVPGPDGLEAQPPVWLPTRVTRYTSGVVAQPAEQAVSGEASTAHAARVLGPAGRLSAADLTGRCG